MWKFSSLLFLTILCACGTKAPKPAQPKPLLNDSVMVAIMVDLQLIEAAQTNRLLHPDSLGLQRNRYMQQVFQRHEVNDSVFYKNLDFRLEQGPKMEALYDQVLEELQTRKTDYR